MLEMDISQNEDFKKESYELQLLEFTTEEISDNVVSIIKDNVQSQTESLKNSLLRKSPHSRSAVEANIDIFLKEVYQSIEKHEHHITSAVDEFFGIPPNVLLPEDMLQSRQYTQEEEVQLETEILQLKHRAKAACFKEECLRKEVQEIVKVRTLESELKELELYLPKNEVNGRIGDIHQRLTKIKNLGEAHFEPGNKRGVSAFECKFQCL